MSAYHGNSKSYGVATYITQAALFSDDALSEYEAPRLNDWTIESVPCDVYQDSIQADGDETNLVFNLRNNNSEQRITAIAIRYYLTNSKLHFLSYNGYDCYETWISANIAPNEYGSIVMTLVESSDIARADKLLWRITEVAYANGEVYMDYDASKGTKESFTGIATPFD